MSGVYPLSWSCFFGDVCLILFCHGMKITTCCFCLELCSSILSKSNLPWILLWLLRFRIEKFGGLGWQFLFQHKAVVWNYFTTTLFWGKSESYSYKGPENLHQKLDVHHKIPGSMCLLLLMEEIPNNHSLDGSKTLQINGIFTISTG